MSNIDFRNFLYQFPHEQNKKKETEDINKKITEEEHLPCSKSSFMVGTWSLGSPTPDKNSLKSFRNSSLLFTFLLDLNRQPQTQLNLQLIFFFFFIKRRNFKQSNLEDLLSEEAQRVNVKCFRSGYWKLLKLRWGE